MSAARYTDFKRLLVKFCSDQNLDQPQYQTKSLSQSTPLLISKVTVGNEVYKSRESSTSELETEGSAAQVALQDLTRLNRLNQSKSPHQTMDHSQLSFILIVDFENQPMALDYFYRSYPRAQETDVYLFISSKSAYYPELQQKFWIDYPRLEMMTIPSSDRTRLQLSLAIWLGTNLASSSSEPLVLITNDSALAEIKMIQELKGIRNPRSPILLIYDRIQNFLNQLEIA